MTSFGKWAPLKSIICSLWLNFVSYHSNWKTLRQNKEYAYNIYSFLSKWTYQAVSKNTWFYKVFNFNPIIVINDNLKHTLWLKVYCYSCKLFGQLSRPIYRYLSQLENDICIMSDWPKLVSMHEKLFQIDWSIQS